MSKNGVSYKAELPAQKALAHLESLAESLKKGSVCVQVGKEYVVMRLGKTTLMDVEISASQKKGKRRLSLELSWSDPKHEAEPEQSVIIGTQAPPPASPGPVPAPATPKTAPAAPAAKSAAPKRKAAAPRKKAAAPNKAAAPKKAARKTTTRKKAPSSKSR